MLGTRRHLRRVAVWLVLALLHLQLAGAAYACPQWLAALQGQETLAPQVSCDGHASAAMDPEQPLLCKAHCQQGTQTMQPDRGSSDADLALELPLLIAVLDWTRSALAPAQASAERPMLQPGAPPPGSPAIYLSLLVLRN